MTSLRQREFSGLYTGLVLIAVILIAVVAVVWLSIIANPRP